MFYIVCFIWFSFLVFAAHIDGNSDRRVNLAVETVIKFDDKSLRSDVGFLDSMQSFLQRVRGALYNPAAAERRLSASSAQDKHLVDYLQAAIGTILTYNDEDVQNLAKILNQEIRRYLLIPYKGCKFHELANDGQFRKVMRQTLDELQNAPANVLRFQLKKTLNSLRNTNELDKNLMDFLNSLYTGESKQKLSKAINNLKFYKIRRRAGGRSDGTLQRVVQNAVKDLLFDHYSQLNDNARKTIKVHINAFLDSLFHPYQLKRENVHLIKSDELSTQFKVPMSEGGDKNILSGGNNKHGITQGKFDTHNKKYERITKNNNYADSPSDSLNEDTEVRTKSKPKKSKKKAKKSKTSRKAKIFHKLEKSDTMRTLWEEIRTFAPKRITKRFQPKQRVIVEEHSAVINIGSWRGGLRSPNAENKINLRAGDVDVNEENAEEHQNEKTQEKESDDEGMSLEFDEKAKMEKNTKQNLRNDIHNKEEVDETHKANTNKFSRNSENSSEKSSPEDASGASNENLKFAVSLDARKTMSKKSEEESSDENATTSNKKHMNMSTMLLSEDEEEKVTTAPSKLKENAPAANDEDRNNSEQFYKIQRRDNDKDDFKNENPTADNKEEKEEITITKDAETTEKRDVTEHSTNFESEVTKINTKEEVTRNTVTEADKKVTADLVFAVKQSSETATNDVTSFKETLNIIEEEVDDTHIVDGKAKTPEFKQVKENTNNNDKKLNEMVKEFDAAGETMNRLGGGSSENIFEK